MEKDNNKMNNELSGNDLIISERTAAYLQETEKWTKFLSIVGFVFVGLVILGALFSGSIVSSLPVGQDNKVDGGVGLLFSAGYLLIAALYFFPILYLFRFSNSIKEAIENKSNGQLETAFSNHKSFFKYIGVFMVIIIAIYAIAFLIAILTMF